MSFAQTGDFHGIAQDMLDDAFPKLKKAFCAARIQWKDDIPTYRQMEPDMGVQDLSLQSSRMLNPNFDPDTELLLGQIDDLKEEVNQLAREKAILEKTNRELQEKVNLSVSNIIIAEDRKIDVIKILHSMCKIGLFKMKDGRKFTIKEVMKFFGEILNDNFTEYSSNLSTSKATAKESSFLEVFEELRNAANKYLKKS